MPKSATSIMSGVIVAALITTKGASVRADRSCSMRAVSSLPEPGAPEMRMRELAGAIFSIAWRSWLVTVDLPTIRLGVSARVLRSLTSRLRRDVSKALSATRISRSALKGFSMKS